MPSPTALRPFRPTPVLLVYLGSMALLLWGLLRSPYPYADVRFVVDYLQTELQVAALLLLCTLIYFSPRRIGLGRPQWAQPRLLWPALLALGLHGAHWALARSTALPEPASASVPALDILRTTLLVGLTEEWTYRGVLFAALSAWLGLRRGALVSLLAFGLLHALNLAGGQSPAAVAIQVGLAALTGSTLLLAALATRSLWVPMLIHGLFDFFVIDRARLAMDDSLNLLGLVALLAGPLLGLYCVWQIWRLPTRGEPYVERPRT